MRPAEAPCEVAKTPGYHQPCPPFGAPLGVTLPPLPAPLGVASFFVGALTGARAAVALAFSLDIIAFICGGSSEAVSLSSLSSSLLSSLSSLLSLLSAVTAGPLAFFTPAAAADTPALLPSGPPPRLRRCRGRGGGFALPEPRVAELPEVR